MVCLAKEDDPHTAMEVCVKLLSETVHRIFPECDPDDDCHEHCGCEDGDYGNNGNK